METGAEMVERIRKKIETEPFPVALTKMEWAQIIGVCQHALDNALTGQGDVRYAAIVKLRAALGMED